MLHDRLIKARGDVIVSAGCRKKVSGIPVVVILELIFWIMAKRKGVKRAAKPRELEVPDPSIEVVLDFFAERYCQY